MRKGAAYLIGEHDFVSFCNVRTNTSDTVRTVYDIMIDQNGEDICIRITGNGFLYNMVRIITGTLLEVGKGATAAEDIPQILAAKDRTKAGPTARAKGLTLVYIRYPDEEKNGETKQKTVDTPGSVL